MKNENHKTILWYETLTFKMALLGFMAILFIIPLQLVKMVINERASNSQGVKEEISGEWGKDQIITGPVLNIPVYKEVLLDNGKLLKNTDVWHIMPDELKINGSLYPQIRYRGIYEAVIYDSDLSLSGVFMLPYDKEPANHEILWDQAYITIGVSDNRGIKNNVILKVRDKKTSAEPGVRNHDVFASGITFPLTLEQGIDTIPFSVNFSLRGSGSMMFSPAGKNTIVSLSSEWTAPSFSGNFLPATRELDENGFNASWHVTHLNRNFPQSWLGYIYKPEEEAFGVEMILEVDHYRKAERSVKYGMLFIAFTFLVLLFLELTSKQKIHLFNYFLVSLALVLFFSLLTSLSEHIGFSPAYLISSASTIILLTLFSGSLLKNTKHVIAMGGMLTTLYVFIYILLALKEFAYLAGNIGLFVALAAIMWFSSRTNLFTKSGI